ncbi:MAG: hypothetical protein ABIG44_13480 [Planctomycetota bacterium]
MRRRQLLPLTAMFIVGLCACATLAQTPTSTAFTYQGVLKDMGVPITDTADFRVGLYNVETGGSALDEIPAYGIPVIDGLFTIDVSLDVGSFDGSALWLEIEVAVPAGSAFVLLTPRQPIRPTPYALFALDGAGGSSPWSQSGTTIYYNAGYVGVGTSTPDSPFHVVDQNSFAITAECISEGTIGLLGGESAGVEGHGLSCGVSGQASSVAGYGVRGRAMSATGVNKGVWGETFSSGGYGVYGSTVVSTGSPTGVFGETGAPDGYGVQGFNDADSGNFTAVGVYGSTNAPRGVGVKGYAPGANGGYGVWGRATGPSGRGVFAESTASTGNTIGLEAYVACPTGRAVYGFNEAESGDAIAVQGDTNSPDGFGGYFSGKGYFSGNVGIGTTTPASPLTVAGLVESTLDGFKFPDGSIQFTAATGGGSSLWTQNGSDIYYNSGDVGIGTTTPDSRFVVEQHYDNNIVPMAVFRTTGTNAAGAVRFENGAGNEFNFGITGSSALALGYNANIGLSGDLLRVTSTGNVGIGTTSPGYRLHVYAGADAAIAAENPGEYTRGELGSTYGGVFGESTTGIGVFGQATAETGINYGVRGECSSPAGYAGYFNGRGYFSGNVGIGNSSPTQALDVAGTVKMTGVQLGTSATAGHVLTADASGVGTWQELAGSQWEGAGGGLDIYYTGQVGIGTTNPQYQLQVESSDGITIRAHNTSTIGEYCGVLAEVDSVDGRALKGYASSLTGDAIGVYGQSASPDGYGVYGRNLVGGYGVYGEGDTADGGWAGYFYGRGYFSGDVGIGTSTPDAKLDVNGVVKMNGFQLGTSSTSGYVLTCNSNGVGTWQESTGSTFDLPYSGSVSSTTTALKITNTGTGMSSHAIQGVINNASSHSDAAAGYFNANGSNGMAIYATSDQGTAVHAYHTGPNYAYYGSSSGSGGARFSCSSVDGYGVKAVASAATGFDTVGGWFESDSSVGKGVYSLASGGAGTAISANATGLLGVGIMAKNASTSEPAIMARNYVGGPLIRANNAATTTVFEVANDGTTSVNVLHIMGGADLAENFEVTEPDVQPGMVVEIDPDNPGKLRIASGAYNRRVAGVVSGANELSVGMVLGQLPGEENATPIALSGRVWVHCDATEQAIEPGDMLTTAERAGHAMPVRDHSRAHGTVIGKAMSKLAQGETGLVLVLVNLQ